MDFDMSLCSNRSYCLFVSQPLDAYIKKNEILEVNAKIKSEILEVFAEINFGKSN